MRLVVAVLIGVVALAGCASDDKPAPIRHAPVSLDVVVMPRSMHIYSNGTIQSCDCAPDSLMMFQPIGQCASLDDQIDCVCPAAPCLDIRLSGTGGPFRVTTSAVDIYAEIPRVFPPDLMLDLIGCDRDPMTIPIEAYEPPIPTLTAEVGPQSITARWQTDRPAASAYVLFSFYIWGHDCHTTASEQTYVPPVPAPYDGKSVTVRSLLSPLTFTGDLGEVRLWRGGASSITL